MLSPDWNWKGPHWHHLVYVYMVQFCLGHGYIVTSIVLSGMQLPTNALTSTVAWLHPSLEIQHGWLITSQCFMWVLSHIHIADWVLVWLIFFDKRSSRWKARKGGSVRRMGIMFICVMLNTCWVWISDCPLHRRICTSHARSGNHDRIWTHMLTYCHNFNFNTGKELLIYFYFLNTCATRSSKSSIDMCNTIEKHLHNGCYFHSISICKYHRLCNFIIISYNSHLVPFSAYPNIFNQRLPFITDVDTEFLIHAFSDVK